MTIGTGLTKCEIIFRRRIDALDVIHEILDDTYVSIHQSLAKGRIFVHRRINGISTFFYEILNHLPMPIRRRVANGFIVTGTRIDLRELL